MTNDFRLRLRRVPAGSAITLRFPGQIVGRDTYLRINAAAYLEFGAGNYRIEKPPGTSAVRVLRVPGRANLGKAMPA